PRPSHQATLRRVTVRLLPVARQRPVRIDRVRSPIPADLRELPREVGALVGVAFAVAVGFGIAALAIPGFARDLGVNRAAAGAVISAFALTRLVAAPFGGRFVDRFGERDVMAWGI